MIINNDDQWSQEISLEISMGSQGKSHWDLIFKGGVELKATFEFEEGYKRILKKNSHEVLWHLYGGFFLP